MLPRVFVSSMNSIKPIHLLIFLAFIIVFVIVVLLSLFKEGTAPTISSSPTPQQPFPTIADFPTPLPGTKTMKIIRSYPVQSPNLFYLTIQPIELLFTDIVKPENLKYLIEPPVEVEVKEGSAPNSLIMSPKLAWKEGKTNITITQETVSVDGTRLYLPFVYSLNTSSPQAPEGDKNY